MRVTVILVLLARMAAADPPCPAKVTQQVAAALKAAKVSACTAGRFPGAGWFVVAVDGTVRHRAVLVGDKLVAQARDDGARTTVALTSVDLDGDGIDEVVEDTKEQRTGTIEKHATVLRVNGAGVDSLLDVVTSSEGSDPWASSTRCEATWTTASAGKAKDLVITTSQTAASACAPAARYALVAGKLVARDKWEQALADTEGFRDQMCMCKDVACTNAVHQQYKDWEKRMMATVGKDEKPPDAIIDRAEKVEKEMRDCRKRLKAP